MSAAGEFLITDDEIEEIRNLLGPDPVPPRRKYASGDMALDAIARATGTSRQGIKNTETRALQRLAAVAAIRLGYPPQDTTDLISAFLAGPATVEELRTVRSPANRDRLLGLGAKPAWIAVSRAFSLVPRPIDNGHGWSKSWNWRPRQARMSA